MATEPVSLWDVVSDRDGSTSIAIVEHRDGPALFLGHLDPAEVTARLGRSPGGYEFDLTTMRHLWVVFDRHEQICEADLDQDEVCFCWERSGSNGWYWREVTVGAPSAVALTVVELRRTCPASRDPHETAPAPSGRRAGGGVQ